MSQHLIVALGASAGGIHALKEFFEHTPHNAGIAYVVLLHLSPDHDSQLAEVLQRATKMPVQQVAEKTRMEPDHVYVIPPDKHLTMEDGCIIPSQNATLAERRAPVDIFFRSLADVHSTRAVGVILSGTGANGSMGMKRIKENGGAVFVQNPREAEFNEMPRNSIATDLVDDVLNVAEIPGRILVYRDTLADTHLEEAPENRAEEAQQALREIFTQLRTRTGHDFSNYKRATLMRRIERRMAVRALRALPEYAAFSAGHAEETQALLKDLLISVTNFFRDKAPFAALEEEILPAVFEDKSADEQVRIWVAGCATGEEAYTIAMLCAERTLGHMDAPGVQVFATDIDEAAIATAREGFYTINDAADVSAERLGRFFIKEEGGYRICREIREMVLFAHHNFLKDPPFSRIDLVSCRNVLIYLNRVAQERVMETFHFAMKPGAFMLLGTSESVDTAGDLFKTFNREQHLYQSRVASSMRTIVVPERAPQLKPMASAAQQEEPRPRPGPRIPSGDLHLQLLEQYAPPSLVVSAGFDVVHLSPRAGRYLQMAGGEPTQAVLKLVRDELRAELRNGLYQAAQKGTPVNSAALPVRTGEGTESIRIHVRPVSGGDEQTRGYLLVVFEPAEGDVAQEEPVAHANDEAATRHLEEELAHLRAQLRASNEQHEFQAEELKAGNEELQAMNEELHSASEELETSKEELQSINEELSTVNQELKVKVEETTMVSNNLQNLINSTDIGTIFLDRSFRVVLFTPAALSIFNLIAADYGRPLSDITSRLRDSTLLKDAEAVLQKLLLIEREAQTTDGRTLIMRLAPYRTEEDRIQGVVISFVDITERKQAEELIQVSEARLQRMVNVPRVGVLTFDYAGALLHANDAFLKMMGYNDREAFEKRVFTWRDFTPPEYVDASEAVMRQLLEQGVSEPYEKEYFRKDGTRMWMMFVAANLGDGTIVEYALDISDRVRAEEALAASEEKFRTLFNTMDEGVVTMDLIFDEAGKAVDLTYVDHNPALTRQTGMTSDILGRRVSTVFPDLEAYWLEAYGRVVRTGQPERQEYYLATRDTWFDIYITRLGGEGSVTIVAVYNNITERKRREANMGLLNEVSDDLVRMTSVKQTMGALSRKLAAHFDAAYCAFSEVDEAAGLITVLHLWHRADTVSVAGVHRIADYHSEEVRKVMRSGKSEIVRDTGLFPEAIAANMAALKIGAYVNTPFVHGAQWHITLTIADSKPRDWREDEIDLMRELITRIWTRLDRTRAEEALRESEERLRVTTESAVDYAIISMDTERAISGWSRGAERIFGFHAPEITGKSADIIFTPEDREAGIPQKEVDTARDEGMAPDDRWHLRKDGSRFYVSGILRPIYSGGVVNGYVKVVRDMTDQKAAEEVVRISEERHRIALQSAQMAAWDWNTATDSFVWNDQHYLLLGLQPGNGKTDAAFFLRFVHPEDVAAVEAELHRAVTETGIYRAEFRIIRADDGEVRWMSGFGRAVSYDERGHATRIVGVMYDITTRKRVEAEKEEFIGIASHELKTPLTSIKAYAEVLQDMFEEAGDAPSAALMQKMDGQIDRLNGLISALLDVTRIREGRLEMHKETFDLTPFIRGILEDLQHTTHHALRLDAPDTIRITADKARIGQVITNLLSNAIKYTPDSATVEVRIAAQPDGAQVCVRDYGIGMSKDVQAHVFERFYRAGDGTVATYPGLGLGLYIAAENVRQHGGTIMVESKPGAGSTFCFTLPAAGD